MSTPTSPALHPNDHALRARADKMLALLEQANDPRTPPADFRRALRAYRRAVRRYQALAMRRKGYTIGGQPL